MRARNAFLATTLGVIASATRLEAQVEAQVFLGSAASIPLPITIAQRGQPDLHFTAHWATRPSLPAWYFAWRVGIWKGNRGWRLDHTHHKIYLTNPPPEVQDFRITNGFNIVTISRAFRRREFSYSIGAGPVFGYPVSKVRGQALTHDRGVDGYLLSGGSVMAMATRNLPLTRRLIVSLDVRGSASIVRVPVVNGHATVPNAAMHFHLGLGYRLGRIR